MNGDVVRFRAPWSALVAAITVVGALVLIVAILATAQRFPWLAALLAAVLVVAAVLAPYGYVLDDASLIILRPLLSIRIPLSTVRSVECIDRERLRGSLRTFGSGGLFGIYGRFWSKLFGHYRMYATRTHGFVVVDAATRFVITPSSPEAFVEAVERRLSGLRR